MKSFFFVIPLIYVGANAYLYLRTLQALTFLPSWGKVIFSVAFWIAVFALFIAVGLRETQLPGQIIQALFSVGSIWIIFCLYTVAFLAIIDILKLAIPSFGGHSIWYAIPITCALLIYGYANYRHPKVEQLNISLEQKSNNKKLRAVAISDIHLGYGTGIKALERYVELINSQKPDIVLIAGDLIDNSIKPLLDKPFDKVLNTINAPLGIYMVPGNHEYISDINKVEKYLEKTSIVMLRDSVITLPNGVQIIGRDDRSNAKRKPLSDLLSLTNREQPTIVIDHQPYKLATADSLKVDMLLCGHTHHGQVFPLNLLTNKLYEQSHGYRKWSHTHIWVSSGLSLWGPPFRIGTISDLAVIELQ